MLTNVKTGGIKCIEIICIKNKAEILGQSLQPREANVESGAEPPTLRAFFQKNTHFRHSLV